jgi:hypothetical protein
MGERRQVSFKVRLSAEEPGCPAMYLGPDPEGPEVTEDKAVTVVVYANTTPAERRVMQDRMASIAGGVGASLRQGTQAWIGLQEAYNNLRAQLIREAEAHLLARDWMGEGGATPAASATPADQAAARQRAIMEYLGRREDDALSLAYESVSNNVAEIRAAATLSVLLVSPTEYRGLHELAVHPARLSAIWDAYELAREDLLQGKAPPSGS